MGAVAVAALGADSRFISTGNSLSTNVPRERTWVFRCSLFPSFPPAPSITGLEVHIVLICSADRITAVRREFVGCILVWFWSVFFSLRKQKNTLTARSMAETFRYLWVFVFGFTPGLYAYRWGISCSASAPGAWLWWLGRARCRQQALLKCTLFR